MTYRTTKAALDVLLAVGSKGTWALADAILADVPELGSGRQKGDASQFYASVPDRVQTVLDEMNELDITTPSGDEYTIAGLLKARSTAIDWPPAERHPEAAYRTHQGVNVRQRPVLAALCQVARGEKVARPEGVDAEAWTSALARVTSRRKTKAYPVTANDARVALEHKPNVPPKKPENSEHNIVTALAYIASAQEAVAAFDYVWQRFEPTDEDRMSALATLTGFVDRVSQTVEVVRAVASDEAIAGLLDGAEQ